jgi:hypothetical protein
MKKWQNTVCNARIIFDTGFENRLKIPVLPLIDARPPPTFVLNANRQSLESLVRCLSLRPYAKSDGSIAGVLPAR